MSIWSAEINELEKLNESLKGQFPDLEKELVKLIKADDENMILLYSRRCLEVIITNLCECQLKRDRGTEPLKGIIDKLYKEKKVPSNIITSMDHLNGLSAYGAHPKDFDSEQVKPVLVNLDIIIKWYLKYMDTKIKLKEKAKEVKDEIIASEDSSGNIQKQKKRLILLLSGLTLVIAIVVVALLVFNIIGDENKPMELDKSIAVLPLDYLSENPDKEYLANGVLDAITGHLSMIEGLRVMPRTSVEQYRENKKSAKEIGEELNVSYLIEGSFQMVGDQVKLIIQLVAAAEGDHIFFREYDRVYNDILAVQSEVAQTIAREIEVAITPEVIKRIEKVPTNSLTAYDLYLKANNYLKEYENTRELSSYYTSVNLYKEALKEDSAFARAYSGLANAYIIRYQWEDFFKEDYLDSMLTLIDKALSIDDKLDEAYYLKGKYYMAMGESDMAITHFDNALKYNPNYLAAYQDKGYILTWLSIDFIKCIDNYNRALNLCGNNDRPLLLRALGGVYLDIGFLGKAKYYNDKAYAIDSSIINRLGELVTYAFCAEKIEEGLNLERELAKTSSTYFPSELIMLGGVEEAYLLAKRLDDQYKKSGKLNLQQSHRIGYAFNRAGREKEAKYYFDQQIKFSEKALRLNRSLSRSNAAIYDLAGTYAFLGEKEKAYKYLDEFERSSNFSLWWILWMKYDPLFNKIREEERFQKIFLNIQAKYQAEHERVRKWLEEQGML